MILSQTSNFHIFRTCYRSGYGDCATHHYKLNKFTVYKCAGFCCSMIKSIYNFKPSFVCIDLDGIQSQSNWCWTISSWQKQETLRTTAVSDFICITFCGKMNSCTQGLNTSKEKAKRQLQLLWSYKILCNLF